MPIDLPGRSASGGTAKEYVTCYTCHRGKTEPETAPAAQ